MRADGWRAGMALAWLVAAWACASPREPMPGPPADPAPAPAPADAVPGLDESLRRLVPFGFSGAVLVVEGGERLHEGGYGFADRSANRRNTPGTVFDIGSLSKQFTAAAVMKLVDQGRLSVGDPIHEYLPGVPEDKRGITLHHLLTHTSGLPPFHSFRANGVHGDFRVMNREEAERIILGRPLDFSPGEGWQYSNSGYTLLAAIVERVARAPFEEFLRRELLDPAGLRHTGFYFQRSGENHVIAHGYTAAGDEGSPLDWTGTEELWGLIGNGGLLSTLGDLERWDRALRDGSVLSAAASDALFAPHVEVRDGLHYGYGWYRETLGSGRVVVRHGGANDFGFAARFRHHTERDLLVIVLVNREPPGMGVNFAADVARGIVESSLFGETTPAAPATSWPAAPGDLARLEGTYRVDGRGEITVSRSLGGLAVRPSGSDVVARFGFPTASPSELDAVLDLDRRTEAILDGIARHDYASLAGALADTSRAAAYQNFISGWWGEVEAAGSGREDVQVVGTVPIWWTPGDDRLATVIRAVVGGRPEFFRIHWRDGRIVGLGGGAIREPATTLFAADADDAFVGYHLGIRAPVRLIVDRAPDGGVRGLRIETAAGAVSAVRVTDGGAGT